MVELDLGEEEWIKKARRAVLILEAKPDDGEPGSEMRVFAKGMQSDFEVLGLVEMARVGHILGLHRKSEKIIR